MKKVFLALAFIAALTVTSCKKTETAAETLDSVQVDTIQVDSVSVDTVAVDTVSVDTVK